MKFMTRTVQKAIQSNAQKMAATFYITVEESLAHRIFVDYTNLYTCTAIFSYHIPTCIDLQNNYCYFPLLFVFLEFLAIYTYIYLNGESELL